MISSHTIYDGGVLVWKILVYKYIYGDLVRIMSEAVKNRAPSGGSATRRLHSIPPFMVHRTIMKVW